MRSNDIVDGAFAGDGAVYPLDDAEVSEFVRTYLRIKDADKRAFVAWFVTSLAEAEETD